MIPVELVLITWLVVSALLMLDRNVPRGLSIALVGGMMLLPCKGAITLEGLPDLDRQNAAALGALVGTLLFQPDSVLRFRPRASDLLLVGILVFRTASSVVNGFGWYDGINASRGIAFGFVLPLLLARIHFTTPKALVTFLKVLVIGAAAYIVPSLWEFRMSPNIHSTVYGYFQHQFAQMARGGFFRPIVFFPHALNLARFFAFAAFLAAFPLRSVLAREIPYGKYLFVLPLFGLILSQSYGPWLMFILLSGGYLLVRRNVAFAYVLPVIGVIWVTFTFAGFQPANGLVRAVERVNPARASSLQYRLDAWSEYSSIILRAPVFGHAGWGNARTERATDSVVLINTLERGIVGASFLYGWWLWAMYVCLRLARRLHGRPFADVLYGLGHFVGVCVAASCVDSAMDMHLAIALASVLAIEVCYRNELSVLPRGTARRAPATPAPRTYVYN